MNVSSSLHAAKKALRTELKEKLRNMTKEERAQQSNNVCKKLFAHKKYQEGQRISIYLSRDIEVSTSTILENLFDSGKECFIPRYDSAKPMMEMVKLYSMKDYEELPLTKWNIKQPAETDNSRDEPLSSGGLDLIIVPGIGFTKEGHRIGNGKGYYDLYIKRYQEIMNKRPYTIALAYREQIVSSIPVDNHDAVIDEVIYSEK